MLYLLYAFFTILSFVFLHKTTNDAGAMAQKHSSGWGTRTCTLACLLARRQSLGAPQDGTSLETMTRRQGA